MNNHWMASVHDLHFISNFFDFGFMEVPTLDAAMAKPVEFALHSLPTASPFSSNDSWFCFSCSSIS